MAHSAQGQHFRACILFESSNGKRKMKDKPVFDRSVSDFSTKPTKRRSEMSELHPLRADWIEVSTILEFGMMSLLHAASRKKSSACFLQKSPLHPHSQHQSLCLAH